MTQETRRHYRTGGKITHAGCEMLPNGKDIEYIVISHVQFFKEHDVAGRKESNVWVAFFAENPYTNLPMVLNATNKKRLAKLAKTDYLEEVKNFPVRMTREETKDIQLGGKCWGLRISMIPAQKPVEKKEELTLTHPKFSSAKESILSGAVTIEQIERHYTLSAEVKKELQKNDK